MPPSLALRFVLGLLGLVLALIGLNTVLGGMMTLGWQFPPEAVQITDAETFARHDSNARYFAGVFTGAALILAASAVWFAPLRVYACAFLGVIALGGLARLTQSGYSPLRDSALLGSTLFEILAAPLLALWVWRSTRARPAHT